MDADPFAPCGINCGLCVAFQRERGRCGGCRSDSVTRKSCLGCSVRGCVKRTDSCPKCEEYPCKALRTLSGRYSAKYGMDILTILERIDGGEVDAVICEQRERYTCPGCGGLRTVHGDRCLRCDG